MFTQPDKNINNLFIAPTATIREAVEVIDRGACKTALVVDASGFLLGVIADPDIRRAILNNQDFSASVNDIMNRTPLTLVHNIAYDDAMKFMRTHKRDLVPILDENGKVVDVITLADSITPRLQDNEIILMAGGKGERLLPITQSKPKPMIKIGTKPLLSTLIENMAEQGFHNFTLSLNYLGRKIENYFGDGSGLGVNIKYLYEDAPLGTAGALSLLKEKPTKPFLTMNCDVLTKVNVNDVLNYHMQSKCAATMCVTQQSIEVPFGVIEHDNFQLKNIVEKPKVDYLVNAGVYVFSPNVLGLLNAGSPIDMPSFLRKIDQKLEKVAIFPIHEYWIDVGTHTSLAQAKSDYNLNFGK